MRGRPPPLAVPRGGLDDRGRMERALVERGAAGREVSVPSVSSQHRGPTAVSRLIGEAAAASRKQGGAVAATMQQGGWRRRPQLLRTSFPRYTVLTFLSLRLQREDGGDGCVECRPRDKRPPRSGARRHGPSTALAAGRGVVAEGAARCVEALDIRVCVCCSSRSSRRSVAEHTGARRQLGHAPRPYPLTRGGIPPPAAST